MKPTLLLATMLFLLLAPSPDAETLSEMSGGFLKAKRGDTLLAAEHQPQKTEDLSPARSR